MMSLVISLPKDTHLLRSFTNPEVLATSVSPMTTAPMIDLVHQRLSRPLQLRDNNSLKFLELLRHLQTLIPAHGDKKKLFSSRLLSNPMANRRNKRFQMLDQDLSQALSTLVTHQEESPISLWDEQLICTYI